MKRLFALLLTVFALLASFHGTAFADDVADEADHLFTLGAEHYQQKDYKNALQYFLASNRLVKNRNVMYNIARTYEHLGQPSDAYRYYQRALEGETDNAVQTRIKDAMQRLGSSVALLKVETDPPGATLYLNRKDLGGIGNAPQKIPLSSGQYTIIAELAGYEDATSRAIDARVGQEKSVALKLTRIIGTLRIIGANGAQARLDTDDSPVLCEAPCEAPVPPGQHVLILTKSGFRTARQSVFVRANQVTEARPDVEAEAGSLVVNADERDAVIEVDGKTKGFTPSVLTIPAGTHDVRVALRGFRPVERRVEVKANEQTQLDLQLVSADAVEAASRASEPIEDAPASVSLVTSPELRSMRYPTVAEAVRGIRGVFLSDDTAYKTVSFRGFGRPGDYGNRVLILVDGHPVNDNWIWSSYVGYDLRADIEDVERIEVVRGPGSVLYGTGAFSGVINLITHTRDTPDGREVGVSVADHGVARGRIRYTHHFSKDAGVTTSVAAGRGGGRDFFIREFAADGPPSVAGNARGLDGFRVGTWTGRIFYKSLSAQWSVNHHDKQLPGGEFDVIFGDARTHQADTRAFLEVKLDPKISDQLISVSRAYVNGYLYRGSFARIPSDGGLERSLYDGAWAGAEQRFIYSPVKQLLRLTGGGEFQYHFLVHQSGSDELNGKFYDDKQPFTLAAGYALADIVPANSFKATAGARLDAYSFADPAISPRVAFIMKPYNGGNVKVMGGKAFRAPSAYELYNTAGGGQKQNTALQPENLYSAEIEYSHRFSTQVIGSVSTYANYITNLIALRELQDSTPQVPSYAYQNTAVPVGTLGAEVELRREWKEGWMLGAQYSFQKSRYLASDSLGDFFAFEQAANLREVPNSPNHLASVKGGVPILARALMLMSRLTFEGPRFDRNDTEGVEPAQRSTPVAFIWDIVFSGSEPRWGLSYGIGVYNAFDAQWRVPVSAEFRPTTVVQSGRTLLAFGSVVF